MPLKSTLQSSEDLKIIVVASLYFVSALLGYFLSFESDHLHTIWPPSGIAFALLVLFGRRSWPGVMIGALLANLMAFWNSSGTSEINLIIISSIIALGYTLEALMGNYMLKKSINGKNYFIKTRYAFRFLFIALIVSIIGSIGSAGSLYYTGFISTGELLKSWFSYWIGDVTGILLFTPLILSFQNKPEVYFSKGKIGEVLAFIMILAGLTTLANVEFFAVVIVFALPLLIMPFLLWLAFRFSLRLALTGVLAISLTAVYFTVNGFGPFQMSDNFTTMIILEIFVGVISITTLILAATVRERSDTQQKLESFNEDLETKVELRTKALNDEINIRKKAENELKVSNKELRKINEELDNFVYSVSHDLRAPIASVLGLINLARMEKDQSTINKYLEMINNSARQQDQFIREILNQSRNARLEISCEKVEFNSLINDVFEQLNTNTTNNKVVKNISINQEKHFYSDKWRLRVILNNLLSNSIRYKNGQDPIIDIDVSVKDTKAVISVSHNGRGIERKHLGKVFKMFYRATDDNAGSGLGLYIVKETIDKLQGKINIKSKVGKGTKVVFEVPEIRPAA